VWCFDRGLTLAFSVAIGADGISRDAAGGAEDTVLEAVVEVWEVFVFHENCAVSPAVTLLPRLQNLCNLSSVTGFRLNAVGVTYIYLLNYAAMAKRLMSNSLVALAQLNSHYFSANLKIGAA
jgi:hypothetical protein